MDGGKHGHGRHRRHVRRQVDPAVMTSHPEDCPDEDKEAGEDSQPECLGPVAHWGNGRQSMVMTSPCRGRDSFKSRFAGSSPAPCQSPPLDGWPKNSISWIVSPIDA